MRPDVFRDQVVIVTGASAGIGRALALQLARQGSKVAIAARRAERCAEITLQAAHKRRREVLMGPGALAVWLKLLAPSFVDWLAVNVFMKTVARRARAAQARRGS